MNDIIQPVQFERHSTNFNRLKGRLEHQVGKAIVDAGIGLRWIMVVTKPGQIVATQNARSHTAIVDIAYDTKTYSMTYKDSVNLNYNAEKQTIHEAYSGWIRNLDNAIKGRLMAASAS